ncbi:hypothetical protein [Mycoplasma sp. P36-A1]|uniref:hypothetical protein n=1 Tax=Mycoplasma sp. P36-A1 TaxID=3252900 RepID=UPI003C2AF375
MYDKEKYDRMEVMAYQKNNCNDLKIDLYNIWLFYKSFDLKALYIQWMLLSFIENFEKPRVRQAPSPADLQLYDENTEYCICARIGML